jgi:hypothetical protein
VVGFVVGTSKDKRDEMHLTNKDLKRFWAKVRIGEPGECWEWQGALFKPSGYGAFWLGSNNVLAHPIAFSLHYGYTPDDAGKTVKQTCGNRACCNPRHLSDGSRQEARDAGAGRATKLPVPEVVFQLKAAGLTQKAIADQLQVTQQYVSLVLLRKRREPKPLRRAA